VDLNGFDPRHPRYATSFLSVAGSLTLFATPFQHPPAGQRFWTQSLIADPSHPEGAALTSTIEVVSVDSPPVVSGAVPNVSSAGNSLFITGQWFNQDPSLNAVLIGDIPTAVMTVSPDFLLVSLPAWVRSGPITVSTPAGTGGAMLHNPTTWCAIGNTPVLEAAAPPVLSGLTTIIGRLDFPTELDRYLIHAEAGEEIFAELYSWDPNTQQITGATNTANGYFDAHLRIYGGGFPVVEDDDSGPHLNAGIGIYGGENFFVADVTGTFEIEVSSYLALGFGHYMLIVGTRPPGSMPVAVNALHPNAATVGQVIHAYVTGFTSLDPSMYTVGIGSLTVPAISVVPGRISFQVPAGTVSGPVNVFGPNGSTNHLTSRMPSWLSIIDPSFYFETNLPDALMPGESVYGTITPTAKTDIYPFHATVGRSYMIEVCAVDASRGHLVTGGFLSASPLDPDIRITPHNASLPVFLSDGNGGPGFNALIGGPTTPAWVAPHSGIFDVHVSAFFNISNGAYFLSIRDVTGP
jgi:hypothetical protein